MNFTREPIIETVVTPMEGYKLIIRNSSGSNHDEYSVNAVEVVSFGNSYFFRNMEKPKAFLLPLSEYEVLETRETRTVLKKPHVEKSIKIGRSSKLATKEEDAPSKEESKKKDRSRTRKRKVKETTDEVTTPATASDVEGTETPAPPVRRTLLPPPTSLISDQISRYKDYLQTQGVTAPKEEGKVEKIEPTPPKEEEKIVDIPTPTPTPDGDSKE